MIIQIIYLVAGIALLYFGAEWLVRGASGIARRIDVRPAIVGLTVVAFGTSAPEAVASIVAVLKGAGDIALGNIIGSNVVNIGLVLGVSALIRPIHVERTMIRREVPICIVAAIAFFAMAVDGVIGRLDGVLLIACMIAFVVYAIRISVKERDTCENGTIPVMKGALAFNALITLAGIAGVVIGAHLLVTSAMSVASTYGISDIFIGITMVAVGTSLPELATSAVAAARGQHDICVGNVVGSNIFNIFCVIGIVALISPLAVDPSLIRCEFIFLIAFSVALLPVMRTGFVISRVEGLLCLTAYAVFIYFSYV